MFANRLPNQGSWKEAKRALQWIEAKKKEEERERGP